MEKLGHPPRSCQRLTNMGLPGAALDLQKKNVGLRFAGHGPGYDAGEADLLPGKGAQKAVEAPTDVGQGRNQGGFAQSGRRRPLLPSDYEKPSELLSKLFL